MAKKRWRNSLGQRIRRDNKRSYTEECCCAEVPIDNCAAFVSCMEGAGFASVTFGGFANLLCSQCTGFNSTFLLALTVTSTGSNCGASGQGGVVGCFSSPTFVATFAPSPLVRAAASQSGGFLARFELTGAAALAAIDELCSGGSVELPRISIDDPSCNRSSATCSVSLA